MQYRYIDSDNSLAQSLNVSLNEICSSVGVASCGSNGNIFFETFLTKFIFHHGNNADDMPDENDLASFNASV